jgi:hypothetical protein
MSEAFTPVVRLGPKREFAPTSLIEALDAARAEAARMPPQPPEPDPMEETLRAVVALLPAVLPCPRKWRIALRIA